MKYTELKIETQRQPPARVRNQGEAMLRRAGYIRSDGEITALGRTAYARLEELSEAHGAHELLALLGLRVLKAQSGEIYFPTESGHEGLLTCPSCGYSSSADLARSKKPVALTETSKPLEKVVTPECNTIEALAEYLGVPKEKTAKALMYTRNGDNEFIFVVVRGDMQLSQKKLERYAGPVRPATHEEIVAAGAAPGYASPIGLHHGMTLVDDLIPLCANLVAGANETGYHLLNTNYGRDYTAQSELDLALAQPGDACVDCGGSLVAVKAEVLSDAGGNHAPNILEALSETYHDDKGLCLPSMAAPFGVYLMHLPGKELDTRGQAQQLHDEWEAAGVRVLYDDRDERAGVKFADADLIGCPVRATVGERGMRDGMVELKARTGTEISAVRFADALPAIQSLTKASP